MPPGNGAQSLDPRTPIVTTPGIILPRHRPDFIPTSLRRARLMRPTDIHTNLLTLRLLLHPISIPGLLHNSDTPLHPHSVLVLHMRRDINNRPVPAHILPDLRPTTLNLGTHTLTDPVTRIIIPLTPVSTRPEKYRARMCCCLQDVATGVQGIATCSSLIVQVYGALWHAMSFFRDEVVLLLQHQNHSGTLLVLLRGSIRLFQGNKICKRYNLEQRLQRKCSTLR